jgi:hypothetical protein
VNTVTTTKKTMNYLKTFLPYLFGNKKGKSLEFSLPDRSTWSSLSFEEQLTFHTLSHQLNTFVSTLDLKSLSKKEIYHLFNFLPFLKKELGQEIEASFVHELLLYQEAVRARPLEKKAMQELLNLKTGKLTVFAFLNKDRTRPGVLLVRNPEGEFAAKENGDVWSISILGLSSRGLGFNHSNGCTPLGVYTLDSVMPEANKQHEFGKYRRLIVNFLPASEGELNILQYLPESHQHLHWWKQAVVGRELGRDLLRIHGTGISNNDFFTSYYPFVPTSGCLATREASILGLKEFHDQRLLLDTLMKSAGLELTYENESKIHGLLYVVEFDDNLTSLTF